MPGKATRWCTKHLKIRPFERFCKEQLPCTVYIAIRSDEDNSRGNYGFYDSITYTYPFREDNIDLASVMGLLNKAGITLPNFYSWRTTGGCWMCPWQRASEWVGLKKHNPDLFAQAVEEEKKAVASSKNGHGTTWSISRKSLDTMIEDYER